MRSNLPPVAHRLVDPATGLIDRDWFNAFKPLEKLDPLSEIPALVPPPPITPGNTTVSITNRTVTDGANVGTGSDNGILGAGAAIQTYYDSFTTIKNVLNTFSTNHTNSKNAIDALNTRMTALENKVNAIIAALA